VKIYLGEEIKNDFMEKLREDTEVSFNLLDCAPASVICGYLLYSFLLFGTAVKLRHSLSLVTWNMKTLVVFTLWESIRERG
jgi:hypothetical protein